MSFYDQRYSHLKSVCCKKIKRKKKNLVKNNYNFTYFYQNFATKNYKLTNVEITLVYDQLISFSNNVVCHNSVKKTQNDKVW